MTKLTTFVANFVNDISKSILHQHLTFFLMDLSDVLNTSMLRNGFFRYLSSVDPGSLFQP
jgi:hypothetical protein